MKFEKKLLIEDQEISFIIDTEMPIDYNIKKLSQLHIVSFPDEQMYPDTLVISNIVGIDESLGMFVIGNRFGAYAGFMRTTTGDINKDVKAYVDLFDMDGKKVFRLTPTTFSKIEKDTDWVTKLLEQ